MNSNATIHIRNVLSKTYPQASIALVHTSPWELLVSVMLSAQCTDKIVNGVTPTLFTLYPSIQDIAIAPLDKLENAIHSTGFFHMKAKHIKETAQIIEQTYHGIVPHTMKELTSLPGVARKTANIVLSNAFGVLAGIAVDTHVSRVSQRLRLVSIDHIHGHTPIHITRGSKIIIDFYKVPDTNLIEQELMQVIPKNEWNTITYQLIEHGRAICKAQSPVCTACPLSDVCPTTRQSNL